MVTLTFKFITLLQVSMETAEEVIKVVVTNSNVPNQPVLADSTKKDKVKEKSLKSKEVWDIHHMARKLCTTDHHTFATKLEAHNCQLYLCICSIIISLYLNCGACNCSSTDIVTV